MRRSTGRFIRLLSYCIISLLWVVLFAFGAGAQTTAHNPPANPLMEELNKYPGLLPELGQLFEKLQREVKVPEPRRQSNLLPLLPSTTTFYVAFPNYGEAAHQTLEIFHQELKQSSVLQNWWQQAEVGKTGTQFEDWAEQFSAVSQYLGEEIVVTGETGEKTANLVVVAETRRAGLKEVLQKMLTGTANKSASNFRVLDVKELAGARKATRPGEFVVLVRPDYVIASPELETVRRFSDQLDLKKGEFASTAFGHRVQEAYAGGASSLMAGDLGKVISQFPPEKPASMEMMARTGFKDMQYLVWKHKGGSGKSVSEMELSFTGPRRGVASWLAAPGSFGSLEFVDPRSMVVASLRLKNLGDIFEDVKELSTYSNPKAFQTLPQMEQALHISLKDDLLSQFSGEITIALRDFDKGQPSWNVILQVKDADVLERTLDRLLQSAPVQRRDTEERGTRYHMLVLPSPKAPVEIGYAFVDGYLVLGSSRASLDTAINLHKAGAGLANSPNLLASLPAGYSPKSSLLFYEDPMAVAAFQLSRISPEMASAISSQGREIPALTYWGYGEEKTLRGVSTSAGADVSAVLVGAAVAIPNLLRARIAANEASAAATVRTLNVAQVTYASMYPRKGYAYDLAALGADPKGARASAQHAGLIDSALWEGNCDAEWCLKNGYRFKMAAACRESGCKEFVVLGSPISNNTGTKNFCSISDGVVRFQTGPVLTAPITASQCKGWPPL